MNSLTHEYIWTASGKQLAVSNLHPGMIDGKSIAYGLAKECRFAGQIEGFYSVARHALILREAMKGVLPRRDWIYPLLHDAAEAYVRDMPKPIKVLLPDYNMMEELVQQAVWQYFNLDSHIPDVVKEYDKRIVLDEAIQLFAHKASWVEDFAANGITPLGVDIYTRHYQDDISEFLITLRLDLQAYHEEVAP